MHCVEMFVGLDNVGSFEDAVCRVFSRFFDIQISGLFSKLPYCRKMFGVADCMFDHELLAAIMIF